MNDEEGENIMIVCPKCKEVIPDESRTCPKCGTKLKIQTDDQAVVYASQAAVNSAQDNTSKKTAILRLPKSTKIVGVVIAVVTAIAAIFFVTNEIGKSNLKNTLQKAWLDTDGGILKVLEFSDDEVEYRLETGHSWLDMTVDSWKYKITGSNKIGINRYGDEYKTYTIEFNNDKTVMTIRPAVTNSDSSENWYYLEDY